MASCCIRFCSVSVLGDAVMCPLRYEAYLASQPTTGASPASESGSAGKAGKGDMKALVRAVFLVGALALEGAKVCLASHAHARACARSTRLDVCPRVLRLTCTPATVRTCRYQSA